MVLRSPGLTKEARQCIVSKEKFRSNFSMTKGEK
jgi:hypothetical protein